MSNNNIEDVMQELNNVSWDIESVTQSVYKCYTK